MCYTAPFLLWHRVGRVCRLWNSAASSPVLWRKVTVGHCWIAPGRNQLPKTETKIKDTFNWLAQNRSVYWFSDLCSVCAHVHTSAISKLCFLCRFSQLRDFSLCHWTKNVTYAVDVSHRLCQYFPFCSSKFMNPLNKNIHFTFLVSVILFLLFFHGHF